MGIAEIWLAPEPIPNASRCSTETTNSTCLCRFVLIFAWYYESCSVQIVWEFKLQRLHHREALHQWAVKECCSHCGEFFVIETHEIWTFNFQFGARPNDYKKSSPENSYIDVNDFESVEALAKFLDKVDKDDQLYNSYFKWKGTAETINTFFWCRVCAMLHDESSIERPRWKESISDWWNGKGVCQREPWGKIKINWKLWKIWNCFAGKWGFLAIS
jgi:hypothetical protein